MEQITRATSVDDFADIAKLINNQKEYVRRMLLDLGVVYTHQDLVEKLKSVDREIERLGRIKSALAKRAADTQKTEELSALLLALEGADENSQAGVFLKPLRAPIEGHVCTFLDKCLAGGIFASELKTRIEEERKRAALRIEEQKKLKKCLELLLGHYQHNSAIED